MYSFTFNDLHTHQSQPSFSRRKLNINIYIRYRCEGGSGRLAAEQSGVRIKVTSLIRESIASVASCACVRCATPHVYSDLWEGGVLSEQNDCQENCGCKESYSSGDFKQQRTSAYKYNVLSVNFEQDWKVSGHCSISVVFSRNRIVHHTILASKNFQRPGNSGEWCPRNGQQLELSAFDG